MSSQIKEFKRENILKDLLLSMSKLEKVLSCNKCQSFPLKTRNNNATLADCEVEIDSKEILRKYSGMFQACRIAARRASRHSSCQAMAMGTTSTSDASFGLAAILLLSAVTAAKRDSTVEESSMITECEGNAKCEHASSTAYYPTNDIRLQRAMTSRRMEAEKTRRTFFSLYEVDFDVPLGSGAYGDVYLCRKRINGEAYALKKIPKEFTEDSEFQREMNALLHIRGHGGKIVDMEKQIASEAI